MELFKNLPLPALEENYRHYERYKKFIESRPKRRKCLSREFGFHRHRICPKSMNGSDTEDNIIKLTPREHFIAHMILWKCGYKEMIHALWFMTHNKRNQVCLSSRQFEDFYLEYKSSQPKGENHPLYGIPKSEEVKQKLSDANTGKIHMYNAETKEKIYILFEEKQKYLDLGFIDGMPWLSEFVSGEGNGMYGKSVVDVWKEKYPNDWETYYDTWIDNFKKANAGENNPMYGKNAFENLSEENYLYTMKKKEDSMTKMWDFKRMLEEKNLKIKCIETRETFNTLNEASNKVYKSNRKSGAIRESILNNESYKNFSWTLIENE